MIGALDVGVDFRGGEVRDEAIGDDEIVNPPPGILLPGLEPIRPPRVLHLLRIQIPERISETTI